MIDPFSNFDSWLSSASLSINNPAKFEEFYSTFEGLLASISQTGFLPEPLSYRTGSFIDKLNVQFCKSIINKEENDDIKLPIMRQYLDLFLRFSLYGIASYDKSAINLAITILSDNNKPFYQATSRHSIYKSLCKKYVEYGAMNFINEKIKDPIQDLELYNLLLILVSVLHNYDQNFNADLYIQTSTKMFQQYVYKNHSSLNVEIFSKCIEEIRNFCSNKYESVSAFLTGVLPLLTIFFSSNSFDQRLASIKEVSLLTTELTFQKQIASYFHTHIDLIENIAFRSEYSKCIGDIISLISRLDGCTPSTVEKVWSKGAYLHASEKKFFNDMFLQFANSGKGPVLTTTITLVFSLEHDVNWFDLLDSLVKKMKDRKDCIDYLNQIRGFLLHIIFPDLRLDDLLECEDNLNIINDNHSLSTEIVGRAKSSLLMMVTFGATEKTFLKVFSLLSHENSNFILHLLNNFFSEDSKVKISQEVILQTLEKSLDLLLESSLSSIQNKTNGPSEEIKDFVLKLCSFNKESLTFPQLDKILNCYQIYEPTEENYGNNEEIKELKTLNDGTTFPNFFDFLDSLVSVEALTPDHLEILLSRFQSNNKSFFKLIKHLIYEANDSNPLAAKVTHLPLNKEDLLWSFALTDSPRRFEFDKLLCQIYASNDGEELTDHEVIISFLQKWKTFYNQEMYKKKCELSNEKKTELNSLFNSFSNPLEEEIPPPFSQFNTSLPILIDILRLFIFTMECQSSLNFNYAHKYESEKIDVTVYWVDQSNIMHFNAPPSTTIGSIIECISNEKNIKISTPILTVHNSNLTDKPLKRTQPIGMFAEVQPNGSRECLFDIRYEKSRKVKLHKRNARVSQEVINSPFIDDIFQILLYGENDLSSYRLFKLLPPYKLAPNFKTLNFEDANLDLKIFFSFDHLPFFLYNLISLLIDSSDDLGIAKRIIKFKKFDSFLIDAIEFFVIDRDFSSLDELSLELVDHFLDFFMLISLYHDENITNDLTLDTKKRLFVVLMKLALNPPLFIKVKKTCQFQFSHGSNLIPFPDNFEDVFKSLILNHDKKIRDFAAMQFNKISIPVNVFIDCLTEMGDAVSEEFLSSLTSHINEEIIKEPRFCQTILSLLYSDSAHGSFLSNLLTLILNMLQRSSIDQSELSNLLDFLIAKFVNVDYDINDRIGFETASKCLVLLSSEKNFELKNVLEKLNDKRTAPFHNFQIDGDSIRISRFNKVGLKNLGMTCYLNATLQQFYAIKPFRYAIMSYDGDNGFLKQLSILFQNMKYCKTESVTTEGFVDNFSFMGMKLDSRTQQDAAEFIQAFFDLFQGDPEYKNLVDDLFKLIIINSKKLLDKEEEDYCFDVTKEPSYIFELEVKQLHSMVDGFEYFIKPNYLTGSNGYKTSDNKNVKAVNYSSLLRIPPFLIIQLMRFEYSQEIHQRKKVSKRYEVLKEINISRITENKDVDALYSLKGVIIHRGIALGGHYISFVNTKKNGWLCFDDESVTEISEEEVMKQASGIESSNITGYILFYDRQNCGEIPCQDLSKSYELPEERKNEINILNEENFQQQLVCSSGYFHLMNGLSNLISNEYLFVCLKYAVNTLPFAKSGENSKEFYNSLSKKVRSIQSRLKDADDFIKSVGHEFISYMTSNNFLSSSLFDCPIEIIRKGIVKLIKSCFVPIDNLINDPTFNDFLVYFANEVFKFVPNCLFNYTNIDQLFNVLSYFVRKFPTIKEMAEKEWIEDITNLFRVGISNFFATKPNLRQDYVFRGMNLTHFIKLVCSIDFHSNERIFDDSFYISVLYSNSKPKEIALFTNKFFSKELFVNLLRSHELINEDAFTIFSLIFHIVPENAIQLAMTCDFKKTSFPCKSQDIITLIAAVVSKYPNVGDIVVDSCNEWMPYYFTDDDYMTRNNAVVCCLYTVPSQTITKQSLLDLDVPKYLILPAGLEIKTREVDDVILSRSRKLLNCALQLVCPKLTNDILDKAKKTKSKSKNNFDDGPITSNRACQFFQLINELMLIIPDSSLSDIERSSILNLYLAICKTDDDLFSEQITLALSVINNFNIPIGYQSLLLSLSIVTSSDGERKIVNKPKNYANLHNFLPHFLSLLKIRFPAIPLPDEFAIFFFENIAFAPITKVSKCLSEIKDFVRILCKNYPDKVVEILSSKKMKKWENNNIYMIIAICEFLNRKRILLPSVSQNFKELVKAGVDVNELVMKAIDRSIKNSYNEQVIFKLCDESKLNNKVKDVLRSLLD